MSWMNALYDTYCNLDSFRDKDEYISANLLKIGQSTQNAHVEIVLDSNADFVSSTFVPKDDAETLLPVTEKSASRSSGSAPHPLFDKLKYLAGDYVEFCDESNEIFHQEYMENLKSWVDANGTSNKVKIVYEYLCKNSLISDLIKYGIFSVDERGKLTKKFEKANVTLSVGNQSDAMIRFRVQGVDEISALWQDNKIQDQFVEFYLEQKNDDTKYCYITGENLPICICHPSKIRNTGDKAKLISSNDTHNFTYLGRFENDKQAFTMSYEASQKCHNALKFLIEKQGTKIGKDRVFVLWGVTNESVPNITGGTFSLIDDDSAPETDAEIAKRFNDAILGYRSQLNNHSKLVLLGLDAATTGRLSVIFSREYYGEQGNELIDNISNWHQHCKWSTFYWNKEGKKKYYVGIPALKTIAETAFGTEQGSFIKCDDRILANVVERLIPCVCDGKKIPRDIVKAALNRAMHPQNYSNINNWYQVLSVGCVLYGKYLYDYEGKEIFMNVNEESKDLEYNCGRLLAVADQIERWALFKKADGGKDIRTTNAVKLYTRFAQKPCDTWGVINNKLAIYKEQLGDKGKKLYKMLGEISNRIDIEEFKRATNLGGAFCLGFDSQRLAFIEEAKNRNTVSKSINEEEE